LQLTDERRLRAKFNREYGQHIPTDLCLCAENPPTKWEILPFNGEGPEILPEIDNDLLAQVRTWHLHLLFCSAQLPDAYITVNRLTTVQLRKHLLMSLRVSKFCLGSAHWHFRVAMYFILYYSNELIIFDGCYRFYIATHQLPCRSADSESEFGTIAKQSA
jgi:hypothetical protein